MGRESAAFVCSHIFENSLPVLLVARENGDWMYLCGGLHGDDEKCHVIGREHLIERDPTLSATLDLPDQSEAERGHVGDIWVRRALSSA